MELHDLRTNIEIKNRFVYPWMY